MSHIPSLAMPHAAPKTVQEPPSSGAGEPETRFGRLAGPALADKVREHPKTAAAAGIAVATGIAAAVAIPIIRARGRNAGQARS